MYCRPDDVVDLTSDADTTPGKVLAAGAAWDGASSGADACAVAARTDAVGVLGSPAASSPLVLSPFGRPSVSLLAGLTGRAQATPALGLSQDTLAFDAGVAASQVRSSFSVAVPLPFSLRNQMLDVSVQFLLSSLVENLYAALRSLHFPATLSFCARCLGSQ